MPTKNRNKGVGGFEFKEFSAKQKKLLYWWEEGSPYKDFTMLIADGAIRSGKTIAMICSFIMFTMKRFSGKEFIIAGRSIGTLNKNVIKPMLRILNAWGIPYRYNRSSYTIEIGTNAYYLYGANSEASQDALQGLTAAGALADEVALMPQSFVEQMIGRCSVDGAKIFMNCNPEGPFHYIKTEFIDKREEKKIVYLHFDMDDNLTLSQSKKDEFKRMFRGVFALRYIKGLWAQAEGVIYDMFKDGFEDSEMPKNLNDIAHRYIAVDYGTTNPCVFLDIWYDGSDAWVKNEYYFDSREQRYQKTDQEYADDLERFIGDDEPRFIVIDPSASSFRVALRKRGHKVREADNDVLDGIRVVSSLLALGKLHVSNRCEKTKAEFRVYAWDEKAAKRGAEQPIKERDHAMDAIRYFCKTVIKERDIA